MFDFLARYSAREKLIVGLALLVLTVIVLHAQVIEPYQLRLSELQDEVEQRRADLNWMKSAVARIPATSTASSVVAIDGTLANFIDQAVRRQGLTEQLSQMSPVGADEIRMRFATVDFNRLIAFIAQVNASGLEIKDIRISPGDIAGIVDCNLVLVRP
jgi:type II secretory pathway component PulM